MNFVIILHTYLGNDIDNRLKIYYKSINSWLNNTNYNFIIIDNYSKETYKYFQNFKNLYPNRIEIMSFDGNNHTFGKGYSERLSINYAINNTILFKNINGFFIITARYYIHNLYTWIDKLNNNISLITKPIILKRNGKYGICEWCYCECKYMTRETINLYNHLEINDSKIIYAEHALVKLINKSKNNLMINNPLYIDHTKTGTSNKDRDYILLGDHDEISKIKIYCIFHDILNPELYLNKNLEKYLDFFYTGLDDINNDYLLKLKNYNFIIEKNLSNYNFNYKKKINHLNNYYKCYSALYHILNNPNLYKDYDYIGAITFKLTFKYDLINILKINKRNEYIYYYESLNDYNRTIYDSWNEWPDYLIEKYSTSENIYKEIIDRCNIYFNEKFTYDYVLNWKDRPFIIHGFAGCIIHINIFNKIKQLLLDNIIEWGAYMERFYAIILIFCWKNTMIKIKNIKNHTNFFKKNFNYIKDESK